MHDNETLTKILLFMRRNGNVLRKMYEVILLLFDSTG